MPTRDAARMSVLSHKWHVLWSLIQSLHFDRKFYNSLLCPLSGARRILEFYRVVSKTLFQHQGHILKFSLYIPPSEELPGLSEWICNLSKNGIKELTIQNIGTKTLWLSSQLYSCTNLETLKLCRCELSKLPPDFSGFSKLTVLHLDRVIYKEDNLTDLINSCPKLQTCFIRDFVIQDVKIDAANLAHFVCNGSRIESIEVQNAENLISASIVLHKPAQKCQMASLQNFVLKLANSRRLEKLCLGGHFHELMSSVGFCVPTSLARMRTLKLSSLQLNNLDDLYSVINTIKNFPSLETLNVSVGWSKNLDLSTFDNDPSLKLHHLRHVKVEICCARNVEIKFVEVLLGCSPILETLSVVEHSTEHNRKLITVKVLEQIIRLRRASPNAQVITGSSTVNYSYWNFDECYSSYSSCDSSSEDSSDEDSSSDDNSSSSSNDSSSESD